MSNQTLIAAQNLSKSPKEWRTQGSCRV